MDKESIKIIATNRKARHDYELLDRYEAGIVLTGPEVKSLRLGKANLQDGFCTLRNGEVILVGVHIAPYTHATHYDHEPRRERVLLLHRKEIGKLEKAVEQKGLTVVPLRLYFKNGYAKVEIAVARGKRLYDKRASIAERESKRQLERLKKEY